MKTLIILAIMAMMIPSVDAKSKVQRCQEGYIGYEYNQSLDVNCRGLWNIWSKQILKSFK